MEGNESANQSLDLMMEITEADGPVFTVRSVNDPAVETADRERKKRNRDAATYDRNLTIAEWIVANCQGKNQRDTAEALATNFNGRMTNTVPINCPRPSSTARWFAGSRAIVGTGGFAKNRCGGFVTHTRLASGAAVYPWWG